MVSDALYAARRFGRWAWPFARPALVTLFVTAFVASLPVIHAGVSGSSVLKGLVAIPTGLSYAFGGRLRRYLALVSICVMFALLAAFAAASYYEPDTACDTAVLSIFALAALITAPNLRDWSLAAAGRSLTRRRAEFAAMRRRSVVAPARWIVSSSVLRILAGLAGAASLVVLAVSAGVLAGRLDLGAALHAVELLADAAAGTLAMWYVGRSVVGPAAGTFAALLWACATVRMEYNAVLPDVTPTALVPIVAALALGAKRTGTLDGPWLGFGMAGALVAVALWWPLLAGTASLIVVFLFWSVGEVGQARWSLLAVVAAAVLPWVLWGEHNAQALAVQTALYDPAQAGVARSSGGDGGLPWEFFYPSAFGAVYAKLLTAWLTATGHWGNDRLYSIAPGWGQLSLAAFGAAILYRRGGSRRIGIWLIAIATAVCLALPSRYVGVPLPSLSRLLEAAAPAFAFGAQFALVGAFFVCLLAGVGAENVARRGGMRALAVAAFVLLDVFSISGPGSAGSVLARLSPAIPPSAGVAFYPFITPDDGPEYDDLARVAHRFGYRLANEDRTAVEALGNLTLPSTIGQLRALGVTYVVVSPADYSRRREILSDAHVVLPLDQLESSPGWLPPEPADLSGMPIVRSQSDGSFLIKLSTAPR